MRLHTAARRPLAVIFILLAGATPRFGFFATAGGTMPRHPVNDRVGRGSSSAAIATQ
jgi:hypothetical protein